MVEVRLGRACSVKLLGFLQSQEVGNFTFIGCSGGRLDDSKGDCAVDVVSMEYCGEIQAGMQHGWGRLRYAADASWWCRDTSINPFGCGCLQFLLLVDHVHEPKYHWSMQMHIADN